MTNPTPEAKLTNAQRVWDAIVDLHNAGRNDVVINDGDRIAQAMLVPIPRVTFEVAEQLSITERGEGGFGSSGQ